MSQYVIFLHGLAQQRMPQNKHNLAQRSLGDGDDAQMLSTRIAQRKHAIPNSTKKTRRNVTSVVVTALCNQPEAFALELGDDQSRDLSF